MTEEIIGYKYLTEIEAIEARRKCADHYLLKTDENDTKYWVDYNKSKNEDFSFWYILFDDSIYSLLGEPIKFDTQNAKY